MPSSRPAATATAFSTTSDAGREEKEQAFSLLSSFHVSIDYDPLNNTVRIRMIAVVRLARFMRPPILLHAPFVKWPCAGRSARRCGIVFGSVERPAATAAFPDRAGVKPRSRRAFVTTETLLIAIAAEAIIGESSHPVTGNRM